jgi:hypothetical protein
VIAHVGGLPIEETVAQLVPAAIAGLIALRLISGTIRRRATRLDRSRQEDR